MLKVDDVGHCELCGSKRNLEVHHIVPRCACTGIINPDEDNNLIVVCGSCHSKLTPKRFLSQYGINNSPIQLSNGTIFTHKQKVQMTLFYEKMVECDLVDLVDLVEYIWCPWLTEDDRKERAKNLGL